jgi:hypothetical protein
MMDASITMIAEQALLSLQTLLMFTMKIKPVP